MLVERKFAVQAEEVWWPSRQITLFPVIRSCLSCRSTESDVYELGASQSAVSLPIRDMRVITSGHRWMFEL